MPAQFFAVRLSRRCSDRNKRSGPVCLHTSIRRRRARALLPEMQIGAPDVVESRCPTSGNTNVLLQRSIKQVQHVCVYVCAWQWRMHAAGGTSGKANSAMPATPPPRLKTNTSRCVCAYFTRHTCTTTPHRCSPPNAAHAAPPPRPQPPPPLIFCHSTHEHAQHDRRLHESREEAADEEHGEVGRVRPHVDDEPAAKHAAEEVHHNLKHINLRRVGGCGSAAGGTHCTLHRGTRTRFENIVKPPKSPTKFTTKEMMDHAQAVCACTHTHTHNMQLSRRAPWPGSHARRRALTVSDASMLDAVPPRSRTLAATLLLCGTTRSHKYAQPHTRASRYLVQIYENGGHKVADCEHEARWHKRRDRHVQNRCVTCDPQSERREAESQREIREEKKGWRSHSCSCSCLVQLGSV
jgi:hypothetical protein